VAFRFLSHEEFAKLSAAEKADYLAPAVKELEAMTAELKREHAKGGRKQ